MQIQKFINTIADIYTKDQINASFTQAFLTVNNIQSNNLSLLLNNFLINSVPKLVKEIITDISLDIKLLENIFELNISEDEKKSNGVVFTPTYITEYITQNTLEYSNTFSSIIDPSCGCGAFLITATTYMMKKHNLPAVDVISKNIYGIDISKENIFLSKILLSIFILLNGESLKEVKFNLKCANSLSDNWIDLFNTKTFDYIIGNPPYVNTHDLSLETISMLKKKYLTTQKGSFNIFYAFIECSMNYLSKEGELGFIIPNNYLTISAAEPFRKYLKDNKFIHKIIDFGENMVFSPVRTYNSLLFLNNNNNESIEYATLTKCSNIKSTLYTTEFNIIEVNRLNDASWHLLPAIDLDNIMKIESIGTPIKDYIHVGIATLKDQVYILDGYDSELNLYYKFSNNRKYYIEPKMTTSLYKVSNIKTVNKLQDACQAIIFPYIINKNDSKSNKNTYSAISEEKLSKLYPLCYEYLLSQQDILSSRDKGKINITPWFAYGRSQGLSLRGKKLLFPTFSYSPKFMLENSKDALFCNGYAILESENTDIRLIQKIINSKIMDYYVSNTSYVIEGNYKCYQKKYIQNFSIPNFTIEEKKQLLSYSNSSLDDFLIQKYNLNINQNNNC